MSKTKVSATVDTDRLARAKQLTGVQNVSQVLNRALGVLIEAELEQIHVDGYTRIPQGEETVHTVDATVWADLPWEQE